VLNVGLGFRVWPRVRAQGLGFRAWGLWLKVEGVVVDVRLPENGNSNSMAQGRSTTIISVIKWVRSSRLSIRSLYVVVTRRCEQRR
jgi:hypothetical protein